MRDRPILFSAPMVRALLEGRKTQTRRLAWREKEFEPGGLIYKQATPTQRVQPGDRLWVRETLLIDSLGINYNADNERFQISTKEQTRFWDHYNTGDCAQPGLIKVPGIHMPRWASRLTLTVQAVKIERLQAISAADAEAEGVVYETADPPFWYVPGFMSETGVGIEEIGSNHHASRSYLRLWRLLHGADSLLSNPEVVALTFAVTLANIDCMVPPCVETAPREMTA